jgi:enterochelin esterase-like enzyme
MRHVQGVRAAAPGLVTACLMGSATIAHATIARAELPSHDDVRGAAVASAEVRAGGAPAGAWESASWADLAQTREPGVYRVRVRVDADASAVVVPVCAGRRSVTIDGRAVDVAALAPALIPLPGSRSDPHEVTLDVTVSAYERRIACGEELRAGAVERTREGLGVLTFPSPHAARGGGRAVVFVPRGHDPRRPATVLVGTHPWNGTPWTYAAYAELLREAQARDVLLLMPSGLGNSLYTADAEDEVMRAIDALASSVAVDPRAVSIWGASMGGAGATTIGFHHPDRFASVTSFFGDSKYDLGTYVRAILGDEAGAHRVNALDVVDNARNLPVWLIHGEEDRTSPIRQSEILASALQQRGFRVRFDRVPGAGHEGSLVARFAAQVVAIAAQARVPEVVERVSYRSVRPADVGAYGVRIERAQGRGDAFVDVERRAGAIHVIAADGVARVILVRGALGSDASHPPPIAIDDPRAQSLGVDWVPQP